MCPQDKSISIYFYFDQLVIKPEYRDLLRQHVEYLQAHPKDSVTLEGTGRKEYPIDYAHPAGIFVHSGSCAPCVLHSSRSLWF